MLLVFITVQQNSLYSETVILYLLTGFIRGFFEQAKSFSKHWYIFAACVQNCQRPEGKLLEVLKMVQKNFTSLYAMSSMNTQSLFYFPSVISQMLLSPFINMLLLQLSTENITLLFLLILLGNCSGSCYRKKK